MIHFDSSYNNVRRAANAGAAIVENAKTGNEVQHFRAGQKVHYTLASPVCFFDGVIIDTYNDNGYFYYTVKCGGNPTHRPAVAADGARLETPPAPPGRPRTSGSRPARTQPPQTDISHEGGQLSTPAHKTPNQQNRSTKNQKSQNHDTLQAITHQQRP